MSTFSVNCPQCGRTLRLKDPSLIGKKGKCPSCQHRFLLEVNAEASDAPILAPPEEPDFSAVQQMYSRRKRGRKKNLIATIAGGILALIAVIAYWIASESTSAKPTNRTNQIVSSPEAAIPKAGSATPNLAAEVAAATEVREPIRLINVPSGAGIVMNIRPARLWNGEKRSDELRRCLGPLATWAESELRRISDFEPAEIDEALICLILGTRGAPPDVAAVIHLVDERQTAELLQKFPGKPFTKGSETISVGEKFGYLVRDSRTVAVAPSKLAEEILDSMTDPAVTDSGIEALLAHTDRNRDFTIAFRPGDIRVHAGALVPPEAKALSDGILEWLGSETEAVAWSVQFDDPLTSELLLRNEISVGDRQLSTAGFRQHVEARLQYLPAYVLTAVQGMSPGTAGRRQVVGRLPAMTKAIALATTSTTDERLAKFTTVLPERSEPNLALATRLAVNESGRARDGSRGKPSDVETPPEKPESLADRLKKNVDADFRRTPLEDAFISIGADVGIVVIVDGKALEAAGYTRNMPQEIQLGSVPATTAIHEILKKYDQMVIVVDENAKQVKVTTKAAAEKNGWTVFPVAP